MERRGHGGDRTRVHDSQRLASRLIWANLDTLSGETYGRVDHVSGWFVKGFLGAGGIYSGKFNDEDFPYRGRHRVFQYVFVQYGSLGYATIDLGYSVLKSPGAKFGPFVGYNYYTQHVNGFGCTQIAAGARLSRYYSELPHHFGG